MALERNGTIQETLEAQQAEDIFCAENANCFPFNGQSTLQKTDEVNCKTKVLTSLTIV